MNIAKRNILWFLIIGIIITVLLGLDHAYAADLKEQADKNFGDASTYKLSGVVSKNKGTRPVLDNSSRAFKYEKGASINSYIQEVVFENVPRGDNKIYKISKFRTKNSAGNWVDVAGSSPSKPGGQYQIVLVANKAGWTGSRTISFTVKTPLLFRHSKSITTATYAGKKSFGNPSSPYFYYIDENGKEQGVSLTKSSGDISYYYQIHKGNTWVKYNGAPNVGGYRTVANLSIKNEWTGSRPWYAGSPVYSRSYSIVKKDISGLGVTANSVEYDGDRKTATIKFPKYGEITLGSSDISVEGVYSDKEAKTKATPTNPGTYYIKLTGKGNFEGTKIIPWTITKIKIDKNNFDFVYKGKEYKLANPSSYNQSNVPNFTFLGGKPFFAGFKNSLEFRINGKKRGSFTLSDPKENKIGITTIKVTPSKEFYDSQGQTFYIAFYVSPYVLDKKNIQITKQKKTAIEEDIFELMKKALRQKVEWLSIPSGYVDIVQTSSGAALVPGKDNDGCVKINNASFSVSELVFDYTNKKSYTLGLREKSVDYGLSLKEVLSLIQIKWNLKDLTSADYEVIEVVNEKTKTILPLSDISLTVPAGVYTIKVKGRGDYSSYLGTSGLLTIKGRDFNDVNFSYVDRVSYSGKEITPQVSAYDKKTNTYLEEGKDFRVLCFDNKEAGTARIRVLGLNLFNGATKDMSFRIQPLDMTQVAHEVHLSKSQFSYTGNKITPSPEVSCNGVLLVKNRDYSLSYLSNTSEGIAKIYIRGIGNFSGTLETTFKITSTLKDIKLEKASSVYDSKKKTIKVLSASTAAKRYSSSSLKLKFYRNGKLTKDLKSAGKIKVKVTSEFATGYCYYTIKKATPPANAVKKVTKKGKKVKFKTPFKGKIVGGSKLFTVQGGNTIVGNVSKKGTYKIKFKVNDSNYVSKIIVLRVQVK